MDRQITAVIPVRSGSQRLKNKNILPFGESNLLIHKIRQLKKVDLIDIIYVSSDSDLMLEMAIQEGVRIHKRELPYADDKTKSFNEVVENVVQGLEGSHIMWTPCVCPLFDSEHFKQAIIQYQKNVIDSSCYDSLVAVRQMKEYLWDEEKPLNYTLEKHCISQELPNWWMVANSLYMAPKLSMLERKYFLGYRPFLFETDKIAAIDIDDEYDMKIASSIYQYQQEKNR